MLHLDRAFNTPTERSFRILRCPEFNLFWEKFRPEIDLFLFQNWPWQRVNIVKKHSNRPDNLQHVCLSEFTTNYAPKTKSKLASEDEDFKEEPETVELVNCKVRLKNNMGLWKKRKNYAIVRSSYFNTESDAEKYVSGCMQ